MGQTNGVVNSTFSCCLSRLFAHMLLDHIERKAAFETIMINCTLGPPALLLASLAGLLLRMATGKLV